MLTSCLQAELVKLSPTKCRQAKLCTNGVSYATVAWLSCSSLLLFGQFSCKVSMHLTEFGKMFAGTKEADKHERRWRAVAEWKRNPQASWRKIGSEAGVHHDTAKLWIERYQEAGNVRDKPHTGRKHLLTPAMLAELEQVAAKNVRTVAISSLRLAQHIQKVFGVKVSARTVNRALSAHKWDYRVASKAPKLTPSHKQKRLQWAQGHIRKRTCFAKWMFTDSKIFLLEMIGTGRGLKFWAPSGARPVCPTSMSTLGVHVYCGLTKNGVTKPIIVTGGRSKPSEFTDARTGHLYKGVCTQEYVQQVLPKLKRGGDLRFGLQGRWSSEWVFQQDNAACHASSVTKQALQEMFPDRHVTDWPAKSPDLSPIENFWAWVLRQLQTSVDSINTVAELKAGIAKVIASATPQQCSKYISSMPGRLQKVVDRKGDYIGK